MPVASMNRFLVDVWQGMRNLFARGIIRGNPFLLACHSNSDKLHEKLQLIFNKYIATNVTFIER